MSNSINKVVNLNCRNYQKMELQGVELQLAVQRGLQNGIEELHDKTYQKLLENISQYGLSGSNVASDVSVLQVGETSLEIVINSEHAMFVEYGTGIIGAGTPHPMPIEEGWEYDTNEHGFAGWWYPTTQEDPNPHKWTSKKDGVLRAWTQGIPSRPFVYDTWLWVKRSANNIIKKNINIELAKLK